MHCVCVIGFIDSNKKASASGAYVYYVYYFQVT